MSVNDVFGEAKFGGNKTNWFKFPKEGGSLILRILPSYGSLRKSGQWSKFYSTHFGYRDTKGKMRIFGSSQVKKDKMIVVSDPAVERITKLKIALDKAKLENNAALEAKIKEQLQIFNTKSANYMNVMDLNGKIGVFSISYRMKQALDEEINRMRSEGVNPISADNGRYFVFTRTGFGATTTHKVHVFQEEVEVAGRKLKDDKKSILTMDVAERIQSEGADLSDLFITPTSEEIGQIVNGSSADLERVLAKYRDTGSSSAVAEESEEESYQAPPVQAAPQQAPVAQTIMAPPSPNTATPAQMAVAPTPTMVDGKDISQMSTDEFLKSMGM